MQDLRYYTKNMQCQQYEELVFSNHMPQRLSILLYRNENAWEKHLGFIHGLSRKAGAGKCGKHPVVLWKKIKLSHM